MTGSLIIDLKTSITNYPIPYYNVTVNGFKRYSHTKEADNLYSTHLNVGDVVTLDFFGITGSSSYIGISRRDFTTEDTFGNVGIEDTFISYNAYPTGFTTTFTATTLNNSYNFEYRILATTFVDTGTWTEYYPFDKPILTFDEQSDGKIIYGGWFNKYNDISYNNIIRLNFDGTIDTTFNIGSGFSKNFGDFESYIRRVKITPDGKILVVGRFNVYNGTILSIGTDLNLVRLNSDGSLDTSFVVPNNFLAIGQAGIEFDPLTYGENYKFYIDGRFGIGVPGFFYRFNKDGSLDNTFVIGSGFDNTIFSLKPQTDGKIVVGGEFTSYQSQPYNDIIRLNYNGSIDNTFIIGSGFGATTTGYSPNVQSIVIQSNNKILVVGLFENYSGISANGIIRLNSDGSKDNTFNYGTGFSGSTPLFLSDYPVVINISLTSDNKILINSFNGYYNGNYGPYLIKLYENGTFDETFSIGLGYNFMRGRSFYEREISYNRILSVGTFASYDGNFSPHAVMISQNGKYIN